MTDYRQLMRLVLQKVPYRQIAARQGCSQATIAKVRKVLDEQHLREVSQVEALGVEDIAVLFVDGRKSVAEEFVPVDVGKVVAARLGRKKPPLKVLWARYLETGAPTGARLYGYDRFCEIVAEHVRRNDLTAPITHVPGHTMQVDWAGTRMHLMDPITREVTAVSVFVATLPYSGYVFAHGYADEKFGAWADGHVKAFEYFDGVPLLVVPDNASTASNQISARDRAREVNDSYAQFLEHYQTAAVPTRSAAPRDKGNVEAGVKVVTHWVIHYLADRVFASLDELNEAVGERVEWINDRTPFRGGERSRAEWFDQDEAPELMGLPAQRWQEVSWRRAKVHRDWHIQIDTIKYSVPHAFAGTNVDVRNIDNQLDVLAGGAVVATHTRPAGQRGVYVTDPGHGPAYFEESQGLWTRAYFLRQAAKAGPATVAALERLLDSRKIEAQGFRPCMNILDLGKRGGREVLEAACVRLIADEHRPISYTGVKNTIAAIRAERDARPTTVGAPPGAPPSRRVQQRDTRGAHLAGPEAFTLDALMGDNDEGRKGL